ncbi:MAG: hypothetical protein V4727_10865 [Verrucomicrobiota bacterium]
MLPDIIFSWFSNLFVGTLLGGLIGLVLGLMVFLGLAKFGTWAHPRLNGGWRLATLILVGLFFASIAGLSGATWGFCHAAEKKLLAIQVNEAPFLKEKLAPMSAAAGQLIGTSLILAENPAWLKDIASAQQLPTAANEAIAAFEKGEHHLDPQLLSKHLGNLTRPVIEKLFPVIEARLATSNPELLKSSVYTEMRPYLLDLLVSICASKEENTIGDEQRWLIDSLTLASRKDGQPMLSNKELHAAITNEGFHHLCCRPAAAVIASQRWQFCLFLLAFLLLPPLPFHILRRRFEQKTTDDAGI